MSTGDAGAFLRLLRVLALVAVIVGAAGSLVFMFRASGRNQPFLLLLFAIWDLSPFVGVVGLDLVAKRWSAPSRATLYGVMLIVALGSPAIYGNFKAVAPSKPTAFVFLLVPLVSWLLIGIALITAAFLSRKAVTSSR